MCGSPQLAKLFDVGLQPIGNRFLESPTQTEELFPLAMQQCEACGLTQIEQAVPARALVPPFDWITYEEPEGHLDELADILSALPGIGPRSIAAGVSFKDDSTLARLERKGLQTWRLDIGLDLGATGVSPGFGVETIQDRLTATTAGRVLQRRKPADILLARHILEHSADPRDFIESLKRLTAPGGYVVVEVPDCSRALDGLDYTVIWEEHVLYYTPETFRQGFPLAGLDVVRMENYPYPFENSLVAIATAKSGLRSAKPSAAALVRERARGVAFGKNFKGYREKVRSYVDDRRRAGGRIALFGAGHLACTWVNNLGVEDAIDCVIDDNPNKRGLYMPGSKLPIVGSDALLDRGITLCLLSLNPIGQEKVIAKNAAFVQRGGEFASIFPSSARAVRL
jgi:hypothetical protein